VPWGRQTLLSKYVAEKRKQVCLGMQKGQQKACRPFKFTLFCA
jgi:hypothetical protein